MINPIYKEIYTLIENLNQTIRKLESNSAKAELLSNLTDLELAIVEQENIDESYDHMLHNGEYYNG